MLEQTVNGKPIIICFNKINNTYTVVYEGKVFIMKTKPITDQELNI